MYSPAYYLETDLAELDRLALACPFATLVTVRDGTPCVSHLPVLYQREGERIVFRGHWARPNPQWRDAGDALLILHGPQAYISPAWYPDHEQAARVPTWNYAVAHIRGPLRVLHDADALAAIVSGLSDRHETAHGTHWRFDPGIAEQAVQLKGIVGFCLDARQVELKFKLNQNHPEANRRAVIAALAAKSDEASRAVAGLMRARIDRAAAPAKNAVLNDTPEEP